jgi:eukaryotic-like serine/threonine-protein kinase
LGAALIRFGQFDQSVTAFREAIRLDPKFSPAYSNLAAALLAVDKYAEARMALRDAEAHELDFIGARRLSYLLAFVEGDIKTMERDFDASIGVRETNAAFGWQAHTSAFAGRIKAAHEQFRRGVQMSMQGNFVEVAAQLTMEDAETHAIVGECSEARTEANAGLDLSRDNSTLERASRIFAVCGNSGEATTLTAELTKRFPEATFTAQMSVPVTAAALAMHRSDPKRALELLEPVRKFDHAPSAEFWPSYLRGRAYLQLQDARAAMAEFERIVDHRGEVPASMLYALAQLGLARSSAVAGDTGKARPAYERFLAAWNGADPDLKLLKEARAEYARLQGSEK